MLGRKGYIFCDIWGQESKSWVSSAIKTPEYTL